MTRDTQSTYDRRARDPNIDDVVSSALWAAAPFPVLPQDAPKESKDLNIDIEDPQRVYAIYRASRRHDFQILVERYIMQVRYGCQSSSCNTVTCFSCRKRLAGTRPIRRYNATSARMLAVNLASQDNPEQGLCHFPHADPSLPLANKQAMASPKKIPVNSSDSPKKIVTPTKPRQSTSRKGEPENPSVHNVATKEHNKGTNDTVASSAPMSEIIEEPSETDHRSFPQNMFGTAAFKLLDWLSPRNLEIMTRPENKGAHTENVSLPKSPQFPCGQEHATPGNTNGDSFTQATSKSEVHSDATSSTPDSIPQSEDFIRQGDGSKENVASTKHHVPSMQLSNGTKEGRAASAAHLKTRSNSATSQKQSANGSKRLDVVDSQVPKGILNVPTSPRRIDGSAQRKLSRRDSYLPLSQSKTPRKISGMSTKLSSADATLHEDKALAVDGIIETPLKNSDTKSKPSTRSKQTNGVEKMPKMIQTPPRSSSSEGGFLPQSLSRLTIDILEFICDTMQNDNTLENHSLVPFKINEAVKKHLFFKPIRQLHLQPDPKHTPALQRQWRCFIEQSLFDILRNPGSLLKSFTGDDNQFFDAPTIWYCMLRLTRIAPSLVFDSLWAATESLFQPPEKLHGIYNGGSDSHTHCAKIMPISSMDAARIISICLYALVAAAPLLHSAMKLGNISRTRSYGLSMLGRDSSALESSRLFLQYEDAFTDNLALRLARRLFAAISTRSRYSGLLKMQRNLPDKETKDTDVLDVLLGSLNFVDPKKPLRLDFSDIGRLVHEVRLPLLIIDWARNVMLQEWNGAARVPNDGPFGGALATIAAMYERRKSLLLGDIYFRTEYFAERLDAVGMPVEWLSFEPSKRSVHLLDYPWLFNPSTLVTYFRAINYSRMNQAYETSSQMRLLIRRQADSSLLTPNHIHFKLDDRLSTATAGFLVLDIRRSHVLLDTFNSIWRREEREIARPLKVRLGEDVGEEGLDSGGVQQEFFRLAMAEALDPDYGTFTVDSRTKMTWFQPASPEPLWKFELIGMIVSLAVYNGLTLPITFPKALYRKLIAQDNTELHNISDGWPDLAAGLDSLLEWDEKDGAIEDIFTLTYEFSVDVFGHPISREMRPSTSWPKFSDITKSENPTDAPLVTNENRNSYVSDYIQWLTGISIRPQFEAFKSGFFTCIDRRSITFFDADTLQAVIEGSQDIDIAELRRATRYVGWDASHKSIKDFWSIVGKYDDEQKKKLLEFVTASDRVPVGGMRNVQFTLQRNGMADDHLPTSYTCYGILLLPDFSSKEVMKEKLRMALENSKGFGFA